MNMDDPRYARFALAKEMTEVVDVLRMIDTTRTVPVAGRIRAAGRLFLAGEGSSRIFPAKNAIRKALQWNLPLHIATDGARQALEYELSGFAVFCASNSGRTQEVVALAKKLTAGGNQDVYGLSANANTILESFCHETFVLTCGWEAAVAATKSVIEQAVFYETLIRQAGGKTVPSFAGLAPMVQEALRMPIDRSIIEAAAAAPTIYFAGYNDGVAEELTLKTNEITRKKSDFLEGTYAVHGIEEVMEKNDIVFVVDPVEEEMSKFHDVLVKGVGLKVIAIADRPTPFPTIRIPAAGDLKQYVQLAAGWNLLLEIGLLLGIDLDKPQRARKVGNEYTPPAT